VPEPCRAGAAASVGICRRRRRRSRTGGAAAWPEDASIVRRGCDGCDDGVDQATAAADVVDSTDDGSLARYTSRLRRRVTPKAIDKEKLPQPMSHF